MAINMLHKVGDMYTSFKNGEMKLKKKGKKR